MGRTFRRALGAVLTAMLALAAFAQACTPEGGCHSPGTLCEGLCVDVARDPASCGACGRACPVPPGSEARCEAATCRVVCAPGRADGDGDLANGCERVDADADVAAETDARGGADTGPGNDAEASAPTTYRDAVLADGPAAYYRCGDAPDAGALHDESVNHVDALLEPGFDLGVAGAIARDQDTAIYLRKGRVNLGVRFQLAGRVPYAYEVWVKVKPGNDKRIFHKYRDLQGTLLFVNEVGVGLPTGDTGDTRAITFGFERHRGGGRLAQFVHERSVAVDDTRFHHVVVTSAGGLPRLFVNGSPVVDPSNTIDNGTDLDRDATADLPLYFGPELGLFDGALDEIAVYEKELSAARVQAHYAMGARQP